MNSPSAAGVEVVLPTEPERKGGGGGGGGLVANLPAEQSQGEA